MKARVRLYEEERQIEREGERVSERQTEHINGGEGRGDWDWYIEEGQGRVRYKTLNPLE